MRKRVRLNEPIKISSVLDDILSKLGLKSIIEESTAICIWNEIVDEKTKKETEPVKVEDGVLYVRVSSPGLRNKLTFEKEKLIRAINEACGKEIIKSIRLV